jgi:hypothetical protein
LIEKNWQRVSLLRIAMGCGGIATVMARFWFEHLLGELARSINHSTSRALALQLDDLYEFLVSEGRNDGVGIR